MINTESGTSDGLGYCVVTEDDRYLCQVWFEEISPGKVEIVDFDINKDVHSHRPVRLAMNHIISCSGVKFIKAHIPIPFWQALGFTLTEDKELWYHHS